MKGSGNLAEQSLALGIKTVETTCAENRDASVIAASQPANVFASGRLLSSL